MRRVAIAAVLVVGLVPTAAASAATAPTKVTVNGKISLLGPKRIAVQGARKAICRIVAVSPAALGFRVGTKARITCVRGVLRGISRTAAPKTVVAPSTPPAAATSSPPVRGSTPGGGSPIRVASEFALLGNGTVVALEGGTVSFGGTVCSLAADSPDIGAFKIGDRVSYRCVTPPGFVVDAKSALEQRGTGMFVLAAIGPAA